MGQRRDDGGRRRRMGLFRQGRKNTGFRKINWTF